MKRGKWIRTCALAGLLFAAAGGAHAQSSVLRGQGAVGASVIAQRAGLLPAANDAIWNYLTGYIADKVTRAMKMQATVVLTPVADDRIFDQ